MKKICVATLVALLLILAPAFAGAQVLQVSVTPQEWPTIFSSWKEQGAVSDDQMLVSANIIGAQAFRVAEGRNHPASSLGEAAYVLAFLGSNPALMPEGGVVQLETFLTLARAGQLRHPEMTATSAANQPVAATPVGVDEAARYTAAAASLTAENAAVIAARTSAEMEAFAALHQGNTQQVNELETRGIETAAGLKALQETMEGQGGVLSETTESLARLRLMLDGQKQTLDKLVASQPALESKLNDLSNPPKSDGLAWLFGLGALIFGLILLLGYFTLSRKGKETEERLKKDFTRKIKIEVVEKLKEPMADFRARVCELEADVHSMFPPFDFPLDLNEQLIGLDRSYPTVIIQVKVGDEIVSLKCTAAKDGYVTVEGIEKMTRGDLVSISSFVRMVKRQWKKGRLKGYVKTLKD